MTCLSLTPVDLLSLVLTGCGTSKARALTHRSFSKIGRCAVRIDIISWQRDRVIEHVASLVGINLWSFRIGSEIEAQNLYDGLLKSS